ncbi:MAG: hypothetical protein WC352_00835 [Candidatus Omnitrophota bacterium]
MVSFEDFKKLEIRVAEITAVEQHPNADRLYVLTVRIGETVKKIVAGIRLHYGPDELLGKRVVVIDNLEPAVIRGVESQGMILAASEGELLTVVVPERPINSGAVVR